MSWAKVKKINSDMSKPLDKLIMDGLRIYAHPDFVYKIPRTVGSGPSVEGTQIIVPQKMNVDGTIMVQCSTNSSFSSSAVAKLYINGVLKQAFPAQVDNPSVIAEVKKGDVIEVKFFKSAGVTTSASIEGVTFCGFVCFGNNLIIDVEES